MSSQDERPSGSSLPSGLPASVPARSRPRGSERAVVPRWASPFWLVLVGLAVAEVLALLTRIERVPPESDWKAAASFVGEDLRTTDAAVAAPSWADPLLRLHLGDKLSKDVAGRVDLAPFERLWVVSIRGAESPEAPARAPDFFRAFGRVVVERYDFGPSPVLTNFVQAIGRAEVSIVQKGSEQPCPFRERVGGPARGGLGFGPVFPRQRFVCDEKKPWLWVGTTVLEDLSLAPRHCIWQHPQGAEPVAVTFRDLHLGERLVLYAGLDYHDERDEKGAAVTMRVLLDEQEIGRLVHEDGDGMKRVEISTHGLSSTLRGDLRFEVTSDRPQRRSFCWAGTIQDARRREGS